MPDVLFPSADSLAVITENTSQFVAAGVGLGFVAWGLGFVIWFIVDALRF